MISREDVEAICLDTMRTTLNDYELIKAELNSLKTGERVLMPINKEHAKWMLIIAMNYIGVKPGEPITFTKEENA